MKKFEISVADRTKDDWTTYGQKLSKNEPDYRDLFEYSPELLVLMRSLIPVIEHARDGDRTTFFAVEALLGRMNRVLKELKHIKF